jgi:hypothetical protein
MSQQLQYPQTGQYGTDVPAQGSFQTRQGPTQAIGQAQAGQAQIGQGVADRFADSVPNEVVTAVQELDRLETVCGWAHTRAMDKNAPTVAKLCADLEEIAHLQKELIIRQSPLARPIGNAVRQSIQTALGTLQGFGTQGDVQEVITVAQRTGSILEGALDRLQSFDTGQVGPMAQGQVDTMARGQFGGANVYGQMGP